ncbi:nuclease-related domain-containing protein [Bhargavaea beijingensis]|nr:nuclease-related domain-containing protein [Bhargavaea beijingensis]
MKDRARPGIEKVCDAGLRRLWPDNPVAGKLEERRKQAEAGFGGEERVDSVLAEYRHPGPIRIIPDVGLVCGSRFQLDVLVLTQSWACLLEVKNISGRSVIKDIPPQLVRITKDGREEALGSPFAQLDSNLMLFRDWLHERNTPIPVYGAVVFAYPSQMVEAAAATHPILFPNRIPFFLRNLPGRPLLDEHDLNELTRQVLVSHEPFVQRPLCTMYPQVTERTVRTGVMCTACGEFGMRWRDRAWHCSCSCSCISRSAHVKAIQDWFHIFSGGMTNEECRRFLEVEDRHAARRMMKSAGLIEKGKADGKPIINHDFGALREGALF